MQLKNGRGALDGTVSRKRIIFTFKKHLLSIQSHGFHYDISLYPCPLYRILIYTLTFPYSLFHPPPREIRKHLEVNRDKTHHIAQTCRLIQKVVLKEKLVADIEKEEKDHNKDNFTSCRTKHTHTVYYQSIIQTPKVVFRKKPKPVEGRKW